MINSIVILGSGNLAYHLANFFSIKNIKILQIFSRNVDTGKQLADKIKAEFISNINRITDQADLYILAMSDKANVEIINNAKNISNKLIVHTSGSLPLNILESITYQAGVLYPFQTFTKDIEMLDYEKIPFCIEASNEKTLNILIDLCNKLNVKYYVVDSEHREKIHLAGVFACNFMNHCVYIGEKILMDNNINTEILKPILEQSFYKILKYGAYFSQTGPAIRNDNIIIEKHTKLLGENSLEAQIYKSLSKNISLTYKGKNNKTNG